MWKQAEDVDRMYDPTRSHTDDREDILDQPAADPRKSSRQPRPAPPRSRAPAERKEAHFLIFKPSTIKDW